MSVPPTNAPRRLAVVVSHPTQYYAPWFRWLAAHTALELRVFYLWEAGATPTRDAAFGETFSWDVDLLSGYAHEFVPNRAARPGTDRFAGLRNPSIGARLAAFRPQAILLFGYAHATHLHVIAWARLHRVPLIFRGDSHLLGRETSATRGARAVLIRALFAQFAALLPVGAANRDYFTAFGVPARKLHFAPHAVDASRFDPARADVLAEAAALRASLGIAATTRVVLFAGKLIADKQPHALLAAFLALARTDAALVFVGAGAELATLQTEAQRARPGTVHFLPFANQSAMPARYTLADVFVLPSRGCYETWGLAVNEAMHLGVPCVVSDRVGCQRDLVTPGDTGWVFPAENTPALTATLDAALATPPSALRAAVLARIAGYTYAQTTVGLLRALEAIR